MPRKKKPSLGKAIMNLVASALSIEGWFTKILGLIKAEVRVTSQCLIWMVIFAVFAAMLGFSLWALLLIALYLYLISFNMGFYLPVLIIILLNIILLLLVTFKINHLQKKLFAKKRL